MNTYTLTFDPSGWLEISYTDDGVVLQCTSYHPTQLELINADCEKHGVTIEGDDAEAISLWIAAYVPPKEPVYVRTKADVIGELAQLDVKSIRALRERNEERLNTIEAQAVKLREELSKME